MREVSRIQAENICKELIEISSDTEHRMTRTSNCLVDYALIKITEQSTLLKDKNMEDKEKSLQVRAIDILSKYLNDLDKKDNLTEKEAELVLAIQEVARLKIIKLGDVKNGFPPTGKKIKKMIKIIQESHSIDFRAIIWDDLIDVVDIDGNSISIDSSDLI